MILDANLNNCDKSKFNVIRLPHILSIRNFSKEDKTKFKSNIDEESIKQEYLKLNKKK